MSPTYLGFRVRTGCNRWPDVPNHPSNIVLHAFTYSGGPGISEYSQAAVYIESIFGAKHTLGKGLGQEARYQGLKCTADLCFLAALRPPSI